jgi:hypothetical protein
MSKRDISKAAAWDDQPSYEYYVSFEDMPAVYNYGVGAWYIYDNLPAVCFARWGGGLCFGTNDGRICMLHESFRGDDGRPVGSYWESGAMDFGENWRRKFTDMLWVVAKPDSGGRVVVTAQTDRESAHMRYTVATGLATFSHVDFRHFSFNVNRKPQSRKRKLRARKFAFLKLILTSDPDSSSGGATVMSLAVKVRFGGEAR